MPDMASLAAADFDVDVRSGFCPPQPPLAQLAPCDLGAAAQPADGYGRWEQLLRLAQSPAGGVRLAGDAADQHIDGQAFSAATLRRRARVWRFAVRSMPVLPLDEHMRQDIRWVRRAHLVLAFLAHYYIHSQPARSSVPLDPTTDEEDQLWQQEENAGQHLDRVPASIAIPWAQASKQLGLPPILTYATTVLWNWHWHPCNTQGLAGVVAAASQGRAGTVAPTAPADPCATQEPGSDVGVAINETFTGLDSECWFYLGSLRVELCGVRALELMRRSLDEVFMSDELAADRVAGYLTLLAAEVDRMAHAFTKISNGCVPEEFYWAIRPWFRGSDASVDGRGWVFEGVGEPVHDPTRPGGIDYPRRHVAGPSAGQSSLIHALDAFLDVDHGHGRVRSRHGAENRGKETFMERMMLYMPSHHRAFLTHLRTLKWDPEEEEEEGDDDGDDCDDHNGNRGKLAERLEVQLKAQKDVERGIAAEERDEIEGTKKLHPLRAFVLQQRLTHAHVGEAYDSAISALKRLRDEHVKIVTLYVIQQARRPPPAHLAVGMVAANNMTVPAPTVSIERGRAVHASTPSSASSSASGTAFDENPSSKDATLIGTGGTPLVQFLKDCRRNTVDTLLSAETSR